MTKHLKLAVDVSKMSLVWVLMIGFYLVLYYSKASEAVKKLYYDTAGIPYWIMQGKFHPYYVRKDNK